MYVNVFIKSDRILSSEQIMNLPPQIVKTLNSSIPTRMLCNIFSLGRQLCGGKWKTPACCLLFPVFSYHPNVPFTIGVHFSNPLFIICHLRRIESMNCNFFNRVLFSAQHTCHTSSSEQREQGHF